MLKTLLKPIYYHSRNFIESRRAESRKRRSIRELERLDNRLLDDIGLRRRSDGVIVSVKSKPVSLATDTDNTTLFGIDIQNAKKREGRLRHPYLLRRRL